MTHAAGYFEYCWIASRACCSASVSFFFLKELQAFSYWLLAFEGTPNLTALTVAPRTSGSAHGRHASSSATTGFGGGCVVVGKNTPGSAVGSVPGCPGCMGGGTGRTGALPPGTPPLDPPAPPLGGPPFCARIGKANGAIAKIQNARGFRQAIRCLIRKAAISQMLYPFLADCRLSCDADFRRIFARSIVRWPREEAVAITNRTSERHEPQAAKGSRE